MAFGRTDVEDTPNDEPEEDEEECGYISTWYSDANDSDSLQTIIVELGGGAFCGT